MESILRLDRDASIIAQVCVKATAELYSRQPLDTIRSQELFDAASQMFAWIVQMSKVPDAHGNINRQNTFQHQQASVPQMAQAQLSSANMVMQQSAQEAEGQPLNVEIIKI